jgi:hypothetical protein
MYLPATNTLGFSTNGTNAVTIDASQNVGVGVTPSTWSLGRAIELYAKGSAIWNPNGTNDLRLTSNISYNSAFLYGANGYGNMFTIGGTSGTFQWYTAPNNVSGAGATATLTQAMTLDASGNLRLGTTNAIVASSERLTVSVSGPTNAGVFANGGGATDATVYIVNQSTSGNNLFTSFATEAGAGTVRGSITYNRAGGLTAYNVTSDYRAKTVNGLVQNALQKVAQLKPCSGRMNDAEQDIDFFVAHELQEVVPSAVTGEKDAVNEDGTLNYQMVDKSALIPLLTAAIQELKALNDTLTARITALEGN